MEGIEWCAMCYFGSLWAKLECVGNFCVFGVRLPSINIL